MHHLLKTVWNASLDLIFPRNCCNCNSLVEDKPYEYLCFACVTALILILQPACCSCGRPFYGHMANDTTCFDCRERNFAFQNGRSIFLYEGVGKSIIQILKYHKGRYLKKDLLNILSQHLKGCTFYNDACLVPVPLHPSKYNLRGFNQAEWIAELFLELSSGCTLENILIKSKNTSSQTTNTRQQRFKNIHNSFKLRKDVEISPKKRYIIVDDVYTTGATLNACAELLYAAGAKYIDITTLSHG